MFAYFNICGYNVLVKNTFLQKWGKGMKEKITKAFEYLNRFIQSELYVVLVALLVFIGWFYNIWPIMLCVLLVISVLPLFFSKETKHLIPFLMYMTMIISNNRHNLHSYVYLLIPIVVLLLVGCIFSVVRFKRDWSVLGITKIKGFHFSVLLLAIPFAFGGLGSPYENWVAVLVAFLLVVVVGLGYSFFVVTNTGEERKKLVEYMSFIFFVLGLLVSAQIVTFYGRNCSTWEECLAIKGNFNIGWAGKNNVAPVLALAIPVTFIRCVKKNKIVPLYIVLIVFYYALLIILSCRGALLFAVVAFPFMAFYVASKTENKFQFGFTISMLFVGAVVLIGFYGNEIIKVITPLLDKGFDSSSRIESLYPEAIEVFKRWPACGAGWDYKLGVRVEGAENNGYTPYWYHSTFFQVVADMGIIGIIFFLIYYYWRLRSFAPIVKTPTGLALLVSVLIWEGYGMIDTNYFGPTFFIMTILISFTVESASDLDKGLALDVFPLRRLLAKLKAKQLSVEIVPSEPEENDE